MFRRCTASLGLLTVALILGVGPAPASAASIVSELVTGSSDTIVPYGTPGSTLYAYYQLTNPTSTTNTDLIVSTVTPSNAIQPISAPTSPLSIVNGSFGFDQSNLQVLLSPSDQTNQEIALLFANGGIAPGGTLNFKVSLDPSYSLLTAPILTLQSPDANLSTTAPNLLSYTPTVANGAVPAPTAPLTNTPEPVSLALWSALAAAGFLRARAFRRSGRNPSTLG